MSCGPIFFTVEGQPVGFRRTGGFGKHRFKDKGQRDYQFLVRSLASCYIDRPIRGHVWVEMDFYYRDRRVRDLDNSVKCVLDAMNGVAFIDDSQVTTLVARKHLDKENPRVEIMLQLDGEAIFFARLSETARRFFQRGGKSAEYLWGENVELT